MSARKKALLTLPLIVVMVFSLLVPMQVQVYAATDGYKVTKDMSHIEGDYVAKVWENSKSYIYIVQKSKTYALVKQNKYTGKVKTLVKELPNNGKINKKDGYIINAIYRNYVYLTRSHYSDKSYRTYRYNLKTGKLTRVKDY